MEYKTQMEAAKKGIVTKELAAVAKKEGFTEAELLPAGGIRPGDYPGKRAA